MAKPLSLDRVVEDRGQDRQFLISRLKLAFKEEFRHSKINSKTKTGT
jgi:hypothetical protein